MKIQNQKGLTTFWGISVILMEAVVVFFVFYILYFFWIENPIPTSNILIVKTFAQNKPVDIPDKIDTAGWVDYVNANYGFSLKIPADYKFTDSMVAYGTNEGVEYSFAKSGASSFSLRIFESSADEEIPDAFERITNIDASIYQSYDEKIDKTRAVIYRQVAGSETGDKIYFIGNGYLFESNFDDFSANILSTFKFFKPSAETNTNSES